MADSERDPLAAALIDAFGWKRVQPELVERTRAALAARGWRLVPSAPEDDDLTNYQRGYVDGFDAPANVALRAAQPSAEPGLDVREAAAWVLRAHDAYVEAVNGNGHAGTEHDRMIHFGPARADEVEIFDMVGDCAACGGAQYGTEDDLSHAFVALRLALGQPLKPWETHYAAALASKARS